jgi:hypothetical protein
MKNSENKIKRTVTSKRKYTKSFQGSVVTVLKPVDYSQALLETEKKELINNIWSGQGSLASIELELNISKTPNKIPSHIE